MGAIQYDLRIGSVQGSADLFSAKTGTDTSVTVDGLPTSGQPVFVRLWTLTERQRWEYEDYSYTAGQEAAVMSQPVAGSSLPGAIVSFQWSPGIGALRYELRIGTTAGGFDLYSGNQGTNVSATVASLPTDGRLLFVRLWTLTSRSQWVFRDYQYVAANSRAILTAPAAGSVLTSTDVMFQWTAGVGAQRYNLRIGNSVGASDLYSGNEGTRLSAVVTNLPSDGRAIYVRLWTLTERTAWVHEDYVFTAASDKAVMITPAPGTMLQGPAVTFTWSAALGTPQYQLRIGYTREGSEYGSIVTSTTSATLSNLPVDGRTLYARLWTLTGNGWKYNDYVYRSMDPRAQITTPVIGSRLGTSVTFNWTTGLNAQDYNLQVGFGAGASELFSGRTTMTSATVHGIPTNGRSIAVRLWTLTGGQWMFNDYVYTSVGGRAVMTAPVPGTALESDEVEFRWTADEYAVQYQLSIGTSVGASDLYHGNLGTQGSVRISGLPTDGRQLFVRLWTLTSRQVWEYEDYTYLAVDEVATLVAPAANSALTSASATFQWRAAIGAQRYELFVGSAIEGTDLYAGVAGTNLIAVVNGLPTDGRRLYVRLATLTRHSIWKYRDHVVRAAAAHAVMLEPLLTSVLASSVTFTWSQGFGSSEYELRVGRTPDGGEYYSGNENQSLSRVVNGLPLDGSVVHVRLSSKVDGTWIHERYEYAAGSAAARMLSPASGSVITSPNVEFVWNPGVDVSEYRLDLGWSVGASDVLSARGATLLRVPVTFALDGRPLHARLWSRVAGEWQTIDYVYQTSRLARLTGPAPGSVLVAPTTFTWAAGYQATEYTLSIDSRAAGGTGVFEGHFTNEGTAQVDRLPADGGSVYVRLSTRLDGSWQHVDYVYRAGLDAARLLNNLTVPLSSSSVEFSWHPATYGNRYWLMIGNEEGQGDIYSADQERRQSITVNDLPVDGRSFYIRLWSLVNYTWLFHDYRVVAASRKAQLVTPAPGSELPGSAATFSWAPGLGATRYELRLGSSQGAADVFMADMGVDTAVTVANLPDGGRTVYVRLSSLSQQGWEFNDYELTAASRLAELESPVESELPDSTVTFSWSAVAGGAQYELDLGSTQGGSDIHDGAAGLQLERTVSGLPTDGRTVHVRLWTIRSSREYRDYQFTAVTLSALRPIAQNSSVAFIGTNRVALNGTIHPRGLYTTYFAEYGPDASLGSRTEAFALPAQPTSCYVANFDQDLGGWESWGSISRMPSGGVSGGYLSTLNDGDIDKNHEDGIGSLQLTKYLRTHAMANRGPDFRNARVSMWLRGRNWDPRNSEFLPFFQMWTDVETRANWAMTAADMTPALLSGNWQRVEYTVREDFEWFSYAGNNPTDQGQDSRRYSYWPLRESLTSVDGDMFSLLAFVDPDNRPAGGIDVDEFQLCYANSSLLYSTNGGRLLREPTQGSGAVLTDGWTQGDNRQWLSVASPTEPQEFVYAFDRPVALSTIRIAQHPSRPSRDVELWASQDDVQYSRIATARMTSNEDLFVDVDAEARFLKVRVISGYQADRWGLAEIEAFGSGAQFVPANELHPVSIDLPGLEPGATYHYRLVAENSEGTAYGPVQQFTTPASNKPLVATRAAESIQSSGAKLTGRLNAMGLQTIYAFEYGQTAEFGSRTNFAYGGLQITPRRVFTNIEGLAPGTDYYYRLVGINLEGVTYGETQTFSTSTP